MFNEKEQIQEFHSKITEMVRFYARRAQTSFDNLNKQKQINAGTYDSQELHSYSFNVARAEKELDIANAKLDALINLAKWADIDYESEIEKVKQG